MTALSDAVRGYLQWCERSLNAGPVGNPRTHSFHNERMRQALGTIDTHGMGNLLLISEARTVARALKSGRFDAPFLYETTGDLISRLAEALALWPISLEDLNEEELRAWQETREGMNK